ncbi:TPA: accessory Sec system glycosylation chaperone GtfB [Streptococcus suis]
MIHLFDSYHQSSWDLHYSLLCSGYANPTIVLQDDGFLPEDVTSPYRFFTGYDTVQGSPLYFNQVQTPDFWEIRGDNSKAEVYHFASKRAHIHYANPSHKRLVKAVDWFDEAGRILVTDRYNDKGVRFGQTSYDRQGQATQTSYYAFNGQEVLIENHGTGDLILNYQGQIHFFKNKHSWIDFYLKEACFDLDCIVYNTLAMSFLTAFYLDKEGEDILFWQEPIMDEIPGNMRLLLEKQSKRPTKILVQDKKTYERLLDLVTEEQKDSIAYLGYLYPLKEKRDLQPEALILTNSDQLEQLDNLVSGLPDLHFHIGAITEMSSRLMEMGRHQNVTLYPNISLDLVRELYQKVSFYLDINHGNEILSAVRTAFEQRLIILGFEETLHNPSYVANENRYSSARVEELIWKLQNLMDNHAGLQDRLLAAQEIEANITTVKNYQQMIG